MATSRRRFLRLTATVGGSAALVSACGRDESETGDAQCTLGDPELIYLTARVMANEGQHLAMLRPLAGDPPVPHAFERGVA